MLKLAGQKFGRLTVLRDTVERSNENVVWECVCECGNPARVPTMRLRQGRTRSCGCLRREHGLAMGVVFGSDNGAKNIRKIVRHGTRTHHYKAGGTNRAKALLANLGM